MILSKPTQILTIDALAHLEVVHTALIVDGADDLHFDDEVDEVDDIHDDEVEVDDEEAGKRFLLFIFCI